MVKSLINVPESEAYFDYQQNKEEREDAERIPAKNTAGAKKVSRKPGTTLNHDDDNINLDYLLDPETLDLVAQHVQLATQCAQNTQNTNQVPNPTSAGLNRGSKITRDESDDSEIAAALTETADRPMKLVRRHEVLETFDGARFSYRPAPKQDEARNDREV